MSTDWQQWHRGYDDPTSDLSQRLATVRAQLASALTERVSVPTRLVSICSGDGRDALPVLAAHDAPVEAVLIEYDQELAAQARHTALTLGLSGVEVRTADAGVTQTYAGLEPADVFMACGVFGNVTDHDLTVFIDALPSLIAPDGVVIWTRGQVGRHDPTAYAGHPGEMVRAVMAARGFDELAFVRPGEDSFSVGVHRFTGAQRHTPVDGRLFTFVR